MHVPKLEGMAIGIEASLQAWSSWESLMQWLDRELALEEMLADPIVQAVMAADGVDAQQIRESLYKAASRIGRRHAGEPKPGIFDRQRGADSAGPEFGGAPAVHSEKE